MRQKELLGKDKIYVLGEKKKGRPRGGWEEGREERCCSKGTIIVIDAKLPGGMEKKGSIRKKKKSGNRGK